MFKNADHELRLALERFVEAAIDLLDALDGDVDEENEDDLDQDLVPASLNVQLRKPKIVRA